MGRSPIQSAEHGKREEYAVKRSINGLVATVAIVGLAPALMIASLAFILASRAQLLQSHRRRHGRRG